MKIKVNIKVNIQAPIGNADIEANIDNEYEVEEVQALTEGYASIINNVITQLKEQM